MGMINKKRKGTEQTFILLCTFFYSDAILYKERSRKSVTFVTYRDALYFKRVCNEPRASLLDIGDCRGDKSPQ